MDPQHQGLSLVATPGPPAHPPSATVRLAGELDLATGPQAAEQLRRALEHFLCVVVDLRALVFMDVAGMRVLLDASAAARRRGRRLVMVRAPAHIDALFGLTGNGELVDTVDPSQDPSCEDAVVSVARQAADRAWHRRAETAPPAPEGPHALKAFVDRVDAIVEQRVEARLRHHLDGLGPAAGARLTAVPSEVDAGGA